MKHSQSPKDQAGFTLIEALISIVILAFGLIAVSNLLIVATGSNAIANNLTTAATIASQQMEVLKATPFLQLPPASGGSLTADVAGYYRVPDDVIPGVGAIHTRWQIVNIDSDTVFITVRSEGVSSFARSVGRAEFTTVRTCASRPIGCPL